MNKSNSLCHLLLLLSEADGLLLAVGGGDGLGNLDASQQAPVVNDILICLSNMENLNAVFIKEGISQIERLEKLNKIAIEQMKILENIGDRRLLR